MVALWFMFKLFFIKSNLRFNLSSFFFVFFHLMVFLIFWIQGPQRSSLWSQTEDKECRLSLAVGTKPLASPSLADPHCQLKKIKWSPSVFAVLVYVAWTSDFPRL